MMRPMLIAMDDGPQCAGAIRLGLELAQRTGQPIELITVIDSTAPFRLKGVAAPPDGYDLLDHTRARDAARTVEERVQEVDPLGKDWMITVEKGVPAAVVARRAYSIKASAILVGSGPRNSRDYWARSETALRIAQLAPCPVLAIQPSTSTPLHRAVVAVARLDTGLHLARKLFPLLDQDATIFLTHVLSEAVELETLPSLRSWREEYERFLLDRLNQVAEQVRAAGGVKVEVVIGRGDPAAELLSLADRLNVDVVAAGSHGQLGRIIVGPIAIKLMRGARCSVLLVPSRATVMDVRKLWKSRARVLLSTRTRPSEHPTANPLHSTSGSWIPTSVH